MNIRQFKPPIWFTLPVVGAVAFVIGYAIFWAPIAGTRYRVQALDQIINSAQVKAQVLLADQDEQEAKREKAVQVCIKGAMLQQQINGGPSQVDGVPFAKYVPSYCTCLVSQLNSGELPPDDLKLATDSMQETGRMKVTPVYAQTILKCSSFAAEAVKLTGDR